MGVAGVAVKGFEVTAGWLGELRGEPIEETAALFVMLPKGETKGEATGGGEAGAFSVVVSGFGSNEKLGLAPNGFKV